MTDDARIEDVKTDDATTAVADPANADPSAAPETKAAPFRCIISADLLRRAHFCVGVEEIRYYLHGVNIEPCDGGGALLVATDGHRLVALRDPLAIVEGGTAIVRLEKSFLVEIDRRCDKADDNRRGDWKVIVAGQRAGLIKSPHANPTPAQVGARFDRLRDLDKDIDALQYRETIIDGVYPNWRKTLAAPPAEGVIFPVGEINARLLRGIVSALGKRGETAAIRIVSTGSGCVPHLVRAAGGIDGFGLIMPMRAGISADYPDWIKQDVRPAEPPAQPATASPRRWTSFPGVPLRLQA